MMKGFKAYAPGHSVMAETPRDAAIKFFTMYPTKRKCDVIAGESRDGFFTVTYGRASVGEWPQYYKAVTKKTAIDLPGADHA